jgi:hypothetical protein
LDLAEHKTWAKIYVLTLTDAFMKYLSTVSIPEKEAKTMGEAVLTK